MGFVEEFEFIGGSDSTLTQLMLLKCSIPEEDDDDLLANVKLSTYPIYVPTVWDGNGRLNLIF